MSLLINAILAVVFYGAMGLAYAAIVVAAAAVVFGIGGLVVRVRAGSNQHAQPRHGRHGYQPR